MTFLNKISKIRCFTICCFAKDCGTTKIKKKSQNNTISPIGDLRPPRQTFDTCKQRFEKNISNCEKSRFFYST